MRIAVWADSQLINSNYRAFPFVALLKRGHDVHLDVERGREHVDVLARREVVVVYRYHDNRALTVVRQLREAGVAIVWDNDDDLTAMRAGSATKAGALRAQGSRSGIQRMLELAHVVTTPSAVLAEQYRSWGAEHVRVLENHIPATFDAERPARRDDRVVIGWTGSKEHAQDNRALGIRETLQRLVDTREDVEVHTVGVDLGLQTDRYRRVSFAQYRELAQHVARYDIGIAPLADIAFNRARSNVKVKEYASLGVPWLASPVGPYVGLGEKQGGQLVADGDWYPALERLLSNQRARQKLAKAAMKWGRGQTVLENLDAYEAPLLEAVRLARP